MRTATHVYLALVPADRLEGRPIRTMPDRDWQAYVRFRLRANGFDLSHRVERHDSAALSVFSQEID